MGSMTLKYYEIVDAYDSLNKLIDIEFNNGNVALQIGLIFDEVSTHYYEYSKQEMQIILKYCDKDEKGLPIKDNFNNYKIADASLREQVNSELTGLVATEVEIDDNLKLSKETFSVIKITPNDALKLKKFIEE